MRASAMREYTEALVDFHRVDASLWESLHIYQAVP